MNIPEEKAKPYRFQKGKSGNPAGRTRGPLTLPAAYRRELEKVDPESGLRYYELIAQVVVDRASSGDVLSVMTVLGNDTEELVQRAVVKLMAERGVNKKQAMRIFALFMPAEMIK